MLNLNCRLVRRTMEIGGDPDARGPEEIRATARASAIILQVSSFYPQTEIFLRWVTKMIAIQKKDH